MIILNKHVSWKHNATNTNNKFIKFIRNLRHNDTHIVFLTKNFFSVNLEKIRIIFGLLIFFCNIQDLPVFVYISSHYSLISIFDIVMYFRYDERAAIGIFIINKNTFLN